MYSIGPLTVAPGERAQGLIPVGTSCYGVQLGIPLIVVNGTADGPVLCVDAGVHGDEYDGQEAVRRVVAEIDPATLRGTLVGIPCMNTPAFEAAARTSGLDHAQPQPHLPRRRGRLVLAAAGRHLRRPGRPRHRRPGGPAHRRHLRGDRPAGHPPGRLRGAGDGHRPWPPDTS